MFILKYNYLPPAGCHCHARHRFIKVAGGSCIFYSEYQVIQSVNDHTKSFYGEIRIQRSAEIIK